MKANGFIARITAACILFTVLLSGAASADSITVTTDRLNLRQEADANSKSMGIVREDEELSFICESGDWYLVTTGSKTGFVLSDYVHMDRSKLEADVEANTEMFSSARSGRTCILTTHRPSVLRLCHQVYQVSGGTVFPAGEEQIRQLIRQFRDLQQEDRATV